MIRKIKQDKQKAEALKKMAEITLKRLGEINLTKYPSNTLTDYYDIIHKLMESITLAEGTKIKGEGAHQELINYITEKLRINEQNRQFLQQIRDYRNRISYEGFMVNEEYISTNQEKIKTIIKLLLEKLKVV